jgi:hypothetical protein
LTELHQMDVLDDSQMFDISCLLPFRVCHYPTKETRATEMVTCSIKSKCASLEMIGNHHVQYSFSSGGFIQEKVLATPKKDSFAMLMQTQKRRFFPQKYAPEDGKYLSFNLELFNFVVDCLTTNDCSVTSEQMDDAKRLALSIRDVLQMLASRIPKSSMQTEDVLGDGNCGYYAILVGLERLRKIERKSVTEFRKELWEYAHTNEMKIRNDAFPESQKKGIGKAISWETDVLAPLFCEGSSYEKGCRLSSWISGQWHFPLIAYKFQVTIVVYSSDKSKRQGEIILEKRTTIFKSNGECEWLTRRLQHPCKLLVDMASTIFLVHMHGIHYLHLYVPSNIQPPDKDELEMEEPEQRNESNPILDNELEMGGPSTIV